MEFNEKLQELRKSKGLTQEELATALYVSRTAVSKWESGRGYPGIDSLKEISKFFSVSIDELLSGNELLNAAQEDNRQKEINFLNLVFGLFDVSVLLLFFLPLFGQEIGGSVKSVSLLSLTGISVLLKTVFLSVTGCSILIGIFTLAFQKVDCGVWEKSKISLSLLITAVSLLVFIISPHQVYAAVFVFALLLIKVLLLIKK